MVEPSLLLSTAAGGSSATTRFVSIPGVFIPGIQDSNASYVEYVPDARILAMMTTVSRKRSAHAGSGGALEAKKPRTVPTGNIIIGELCSGFFVCPPAFCCW